MTTFTQGKLIRITVSFTDQESGAQVDPDPLSFLFSLGGTTTTYDYGIDAELVRDSEGIYHVDISTSPDSGALYWRFEGGPVNQDAIQGNFIIQARRP